MARDTQIRHFTKTYIKTKWLKTTRYYFAASNILQIKIFIHKRGRYVLT